MKVCCGICEVLTSKQVCYPSLEVIFLNAEHQKGVFLRSPVEDLVSSDIEELAQKCSVSYKVCSLYLCQSEHKETELKSMCCCY